MNDTNQDNLIHIQPHSKPKLSFPDYFSQAFVRIHSPYLHHLSYEHPNEKRSLIFICVTYFFPTAQTHLQNEYGKGKDTNVCCMT